MSQSIMLVSIHFILFYILVCIIIYFFLVFSLFNILSSYDTLTCSLELSSCIMSRLLILRHKLPHRPERALDTTPLPIITSTNRTCFVV